MISAHRRHPKAARVDSSKALSNGESVGDGPRCRGPSRHPINPQSGSLRFDDVGLAEWAGPFVDAGSDLFQFPSVPMVVDVVVAAEWSELSDRGPVGLRPGGLMVEITFCSGHPASGEDTGRIPGLHDPFLNRGGSPLGGYHAYRLAVLIDRDDPPFRIGRFVDDLTGHVGEDVSPSGYFSWFIVDTGQGGHIHPNLDYASVGGSVGLTLPGEQVQENVSPDLVDPPFVSSGFQCSGQPVDPSHRPTGLSRRQVQTHQIGGAILTLFGEHPSLVQLLLISFLGSSRVDRNDEPSQMSPQLTRGR